MAWTVLVENRVHKDLKKAPRRVLFAVERMLGELEADPLRSRPGLDLAPVRGQADTFRVRLGSWRSLVHVDKKQRLVRVTTVRPRHRAYRK